MRKSGFIAALIVGGAATLTMAGAQAEGCPDVIDISPGGICATVSDTDDPGTQSAAVSVTPSGVTADATAYVWQPVEPFSFPVHESNVRVVADHEKVDVERDGDITFYGLEERTFDGVHLRPEGVYAGRGDDWDSYYGFAYSDQYGRHVTLGHRYSNPNTYEHTAEQLYVDMSPDGRITGGAATNQYYDCTDTSVSTNPTGGAPIPVVSQNTYCRW